MSLLKIFLFSNVDHFRKIDCQISKKFCEISLPVQSQWDFEKNLTSQISKKSCQLTPVSEKRSLKCYREKFFRSQIFFHSQMLTISEKVMVKFQKWVVKSRALYKVNGILKKI